MTLSIGLYDSAKDIAETLMILNTDAERATVLRIIGLIFCSACGKPNKRLEIIPAGISDSCIHPSHLPNELSARQSAIEIFEHDTKAAALAIRDRFA